MHSSVVALGVSYAMPVAINLIRGRKMLPETRSFKLPAPVAWFANILGVVYVMITSVLFVFPPDLPTDASDMNYCIVAFGIVIIISVIQWFVDGRKNYHGPNINLDDNVLVAAQTHEGTGRMEEVGEEKSSGDGEAELDEKTI